MKQNIGNYFLQGDKIYAEAKVNLSLSRSLTTSSVFCYRRARLQAHISKLSIKLIIFLLKHKLFLIFNKVSGCVVG